jgi:hypothetical protein
MMEAKQYSKERKSGLDTAFEPRQSLQWIVQEDADLEAELNDQAHQGEEISSRVVNKVLDRIKTL